jgi:hypothetical protein
MKKLSRPQNGKSLSFAGKPGMSQPTADLTVPLVGAGDACLLDQTVSGLVRRRSGR